MLIRLNERSSYCPSITSHQGRWIIAWTGTDRYLNIGVLNEEKNDLISKRTFNVSSNASPSILSHKNELFVVWVSEDQCINIGKIPPTGTHFTETKKLAIKTASQICTVSHKDQLYLAWATDTTPHTLCIGSFDGTEITNKVLSVLDPIVGSPSLVSHNQELQVAWVDEQTKIHLATVGNTELANKLTFDETSHESPSVISDGNHLYIAWVGIDEGHQLNIARVDGQRLVEKKTCKAPYTEDHGIFIQPRGRGLPTLHHFGAHNVRIKRKGTSGVKFYPPYFLYNVSYDIPEEPSSLAGLPTAKLQYDEYNYHNNAIYLYHP